METYDTWHAMSHFMKILGMSNKAICILNHNGISSQKNAFIKKHTKNTNKNLKTDKYRNTGITKFSLKAAQ